MSKNRKPVLVLYLPRHTPIADIERFKKQLETKELKKDYHILFICTNNHDEKSKVELLSVEHVDETTIQELQKKMDDELNKIRSQK